MQKNNPKINIFPMEKIYFSNKNNDKADKFE